MLSIGHDHAVAVHGRTTSGRNLLEGKELHGRLYVKEFVVIADIVVDARADAGGELRDVRHGGRRRIDASRSSLDAPLLIWTRPLRNNISAKYLWRPTGAPGSNSAICTLLELIGTWLPMALAIAADRQLKC